MILIYGVIFKQQMHYEQLKKCIFESILVYFEYSHNKKKVIYKIYFHLIILKNTPKKDKFFIFLRS